MLLLAAFVFLAPSSVALQDLNAPPPSEVRSLARQATVTDPWDLGVNTLSLGAAYVDWGEENKFEGGKAVIGGRYAFDRELHEPSGAGRQKETLRYILAGDLEVGDSEVDIQYAVMRFSYRAEQTTRPMDEVGKIERVRDQLQFGTLIAAYDDTLGLEYYYELRAARIGRFWAYRNSQDSPFTFNGGTSASIGWAWAESENSAYDSMSNMVAGIEPILSLEHERWGLLYGVYRVNNGFDIGEPKGTFSREAGFRFGYRLGLSPRTALDVFFEKRSFHVDDFDMPDLYTKTRQLGAQLTIGLL